MKEKPAPLVKEATQSAAAPPRSKTPKPGSLLAELHREKQKLRPTSTSRHSHFGGTLVVNRQDGKRQYMSAALVERGTTQPAAQKRKNRRTDPFIGSGRTCASHSRIAAQEGPAASKAQRTLHTFCGRFVKDCYGPVMKSIKNEFRRDSSRLEEGDKVVFFRIVWFFSQWWRVAGRKAHAHSSNALGQLIFTMDVFTFNLVLNATDTFQQHKKYMQLGQSVALYSEMMQLLFIMYQSKDSTENVMALGLLDRLFYGSEPLDRLPKLLSKWTPGTSTREYVCDLVELTHVTIKLLEANAQACTVETPSESKNDAVARMKQTAADFDLFAYIVRKIISNQVVFMYTHLLSQYVVNAPHVNHHIVAFFLRLSRLQIAASDEEEGDTPANPLALKTVTLEPMLYNIQLICVLDQILNDITIRKEKEYSAVISFAAGIMSRFASNAQANPMLPVECLFRHPAPHRFCELTTNMYVNEELRMFALREVLLEENRRLAEAEAAEENGELEGEHSIGRSLSTRASARMDPQSASNGAPPDNDDDDGEVEWNDDEEKEETEEEPKEAPSPDASEKHSEKDPEEDEKDDEQWSDRRAFVPKRKLLADIDENASKSPLGEKKQRIQKPVRDDSSDDEEEFQFDTAGAASGGDSNKRSRLVIEDDDE